MTLFQLCTNVSRQLGWYYVIRMRELKSNPIFGFRIPMFPIHYVTLGSYHKQKAQLSQRGRAMVRVIEYFAKSLKVLLRLLVHNFYTEVQCTAENSSLLS